MIEPLHKGRPNVAALFLAPFRWPVLTMILAVSIFIGGAFSSGCCYPIKPDTQQKNCLDACLEKCPPPANGDFGVDDNDLRPACERRCMDRC